MEKKKISRFCLTAACSLFSIFVFAQSPATDPLERLKEGNFRFRTNQSQLKNEDMIRVNELVSGQNPFAIIVSCSDSRVAPEIVFDQGLGELFIIRTAGNIMADIEEGSIEYAADHLGSKLIVVLGHTKCGAVKAFVDFKKGGDDDHHHHGDLGHIQAILNKLDSQEEVQKALNSESEVYDCTAVANVKDGVRQLRTSDPILSKLYNKEEIQIVGAIYNIETGEVDFLDI